MEKAYTFILFVGLTCVTEARFIADLKLHPQNATVMEGNNITIPCVFKDKVDICRWYRYPEAQSIVDVKWRYSYYDTQTNGTNTNDCSIIITNFTAIDEAMWQCAGTQKTKENNATEFKSNKAHLTMVKFTLTTKPAITQKETWKQSEVVVHLQNFNALQGNNISTKTNPPNTTSQKRITTKGISEINDTKSWLEYNSSTILSNSLSGILITLILTGVIIYCRRRRGKGKKKAASRRKPAITDTSQGASDPEFHNYYYITTLEDPTEDGTSSVPIHGPVTENNTAIKVEYHPYEDIPEVVA